jgi:hypothetical protein
MPRASSSPRRLGAGLHLVEFLLVLIVLAAVVAVVSAPLRAGRREEAGPSSEVARLEAAREAKYREIRDAELDFRTGKLSQEDYRALDRTLRGEAVAILHALDAAREQDQAGGSGQTTS